MKSTTLFHDIASALFGPRWQSELARRIDKDGRTIRRYASENSPIPDRVWESLEEMVTERQEELGALKAQLDARKQASLT